MSLPPGSAPPLIRRTAVVLLLSTAVLAATLAALVGTDDDSAPGRGCESTPDFEGGFESAGLAEWDNVQAPPGRATVERGGSFCGESHGRFEVRAGDVEPQTGDNRAEVRGPNFSDGDDLWFRQATRLGEDFPQEDREFQLVSQWMSGDGSPPLALFVGEGNALELRRGDEPFTEYWEGPAPTDEWVDLIVRVRFSQDPSTGFVEVWRDGRRQTLENGRERMYGQTLRAETGYVKIGYYRDPEHEGTGVVFHDNYLIGESLTDVAPP